MPTVVFIKVKLEAKSWVLVCGNSWIFLYQERRRSSCKLSFFILTKNYLFSFLQKKICMGYIVSRAPIEYPPIVVVHL
jgi:hypothetical protein